MTTTKDDKGNDVTNPVKDKDGNYVYEKNADGTDKDFTLTYAPTKGSTKGQIRRTRRIRSSFIPLRPQSSRRTGSILFSSRPVSPS